MKGSDEGTAMRAAEDILNGGGGGGGRPTAVVKKILTEALSLRPYCRHSCDP